MEFFSLLLALVSCPVSISTSCRYDCADHVKKESSGFDYPVLVGEVVVPGHSLSASGLAHSRVFDDVLYFVSDYQTQENIIYTVNATNAEVIGSVTITDATNVDWSDLAVGKCPNETAGSCIYVQDDGRKGPGPVHKIYIVQEEEDPATHVSRTATRTITYELQPGNDMDESKAMFVDCMGNIFFFETRPYAVPGIRLLQIKDVNGQPTAVSVFMMTIPSTRHRPTAASLSVDCTELLIKTDDKVYYIPVQNGIIQTSRLQVLPYLPNADEISQTIAWDPWQNKYFIMSGYSEFYLHVAFRIKDPPVQKFGLGRVVGNINTEEISFIKGLATSRTRPGVLFAVSSFGSYDVLILQLHGAHTIGVIRTSISAPTLYFRDMATGKCPSSFNGESCIYITSQLLRGEPSLKIYVFEEPAVLFGETTLTLGSENVLVYDLPSGYLNAPIAIMIGRLGEIYLMDRASNGAMVNVFQLKINTGGINSLEPLANFTGHSLHDGPEAIDMSPCFDEIIVKFRDIIFIFDMKDKTIAETFAEKPYLQPHLTRVNMYNVAFDDCDTFLTTTTEIEAATLMAYNRL